MKNKIYINDWLTLKPYKNNTNVDIYFLKLSNQVKNELYKKDFLQQISFLLDEETVNLMCCFIVSYFEDLISETNIWNSFIKKHIELYNKPLPFYEIDEYYENEINPEDISFLIWYFFNTIQTKTFINPYNAYINDIAEAIYSIFDNEWEVAPENENLKSYYKINESDEDYYTAREFMNKIFFRTYLFYFDTGLRLSISEIEILNKFSDNDNIHLYFKENIDESLFRYSTCLLGLKAQEWASLIVSNSQTLSKRFLNISQRISGSFFYKGQDNSFIFLEHIASGKKFNLTKKSFDFSDTLIEIDKIIHMGIVRWMDEWWFSGIQFEIPFDADFILDEKNSVEKRMSVNFLDYKNKAVEELLDHQLKLFKKNNDGKQIVFMHLKEVNQFLNDFNNSYNKSLKLSEKASKEAHKRRKKEGFNSENNFSLLEADTDKEALVFYNPKTGCEIAFELNSAFPMPENPFYSEEKSEEHIMKLFIDPSISKELVEFCLENCSTKIPFLLNGAGKYLLKDIDFLLRFWKKGSYHSEPSVTVI